MWLINPSTAFPDPLFRIIWLLELIVLLVLVLAAFRWSRRAWVGSIVLFVIGLAATLPGWIHQLIYPDPIGAMIDIPLLLMFPLMAVSLVWAIIAWIMRLTSGRRKAGSIS
ncbi:hypothetical protein [Paenibacillus wulumuqiensis]|uniref:hypothetical protein n=1 Tax=Paenibacillus wulumuqiensis TaxID=1567107 RepID=UPI000619E66C|nr:hypothetical protein [Paenibacillus wulumuqiensis]